MRTILSLAMFFTAFCTLRADGPGDNVAEKVRPVPPPGVKIPDEDRAALQAGVAKLREAIAGIPRNAKSEQWLPDVEVIARAVDVVLKDNEFYDLKDVAVAKKLLEKGFERAKSLKAGKAPWLEQPGLVIRGYISAIDGTVQPYGLLIPKEFDAKEGKKHRLDIWCHGRGEQMSELRFLNNPVTMKPEFVRPGAFVLYLYGRYCCANKLAGEIDCFEAMAHLKKDFPIDENRIVMRGFSMGGAARWQFAMHYPDRWVAAAPGAGFAETAEFLKVFQNEKVQPTDYEKKLWHLYDCTDYARNLFDLPTVAYSGEKDSQKQAADIMAKAAKAEGLELTHIIGPNMGHDIDPVSRKLINEKIDAIVEKGRDPLPKKIDFVTYTLRYPDCFWVKVEGLGEHWQRAQVTGELNKDGIKLTTKNITALKLEMPSTSVPGAGAIEIDGKKHQRPILASSATWTAWLSKGADGWVLTSGPQQGVRKKPGVQGPIDDAFMSRFIMVSPTGKVSEAVEKWGPGEQEHAIVQWRRQFRGDAIVKADSDIKDEDIRSSNLVLWGDPQGNAVLAKIADKLPIHWTKDAIDVGGQKYSTDKHVLVMICANPLNPDKYVVLNSGFTFREYDYLNNARQIPKLPDWAVVDITSPVTARSPGKIVAAGFFNEEWKLH